MTSKSMKPSTPAKLPELTPEQKADQVARFLSQKREQFAVTFFAGLAQNDDIRHLNPKDAAAYAVDAADALMEKLYPLPKD